MPFRFIIQISLVTALFAAPALGEPTHTVAVSVKSLTQTKARKSKTRINHPVLLSVKRARTHAQSKAPANAKQFDLSGALRAAK